MKLKLKAHLRLAAEEGASTDWRDKYDSVGNFFKGLAVVKLNRKWGFVNVTGKVMIPLKYDLVGTFHSGLVVVYLNGKWGFVDKTGKEVVPLKYDGVGTFKEGLAKVLLNGQRGLVDKTGKELLPCVYNEGKIPVKTLEEAIKLSNRIKKKYEQDPEGLELTVPEVDWKSWYEQVTKSS